MNQKYYRLEFPLGKFLNQPMFNPAYKVILNPYRYWQLYKVWYLERCWEKDFLECQVQYLERCWNNEFLDRYWVKYGRFEGHLYD